MKTYQVEIVGKSPLLFHWDNIAWADEMDRWKDDPKNKKGSRAGDDRSPAWRWTGSVYHDGENIAIPVDNLMRCLMEGGASVLVPGGKNGKTFKEQSQSGMLVQETSWPVLVGGKTLPWRPVEALQGEMDFAKHVATAEKLGFSLYVKRARVGQTKHIRVRARFERWSARGTVQVWDEQITERVLTDILTIGGNRKGLGDWRPSSPKSPGPFGRFDVSMKEIG